MLRLLGAKKAETRLIILIQTTGTSMKVKTMNHIMPL
jgi:hypothetical protein